MTEFENNNSIKLHQPQEVKKALQALAKAKEIEAKRGKKVRFLKQGESFNNEFLTKKKKV